MQDISVESFLSAYRYRKIGLIWDPSTSPPRATFVAPASGIDPATVASLLRLSCGVLGAAISGERASSLLLEPMGRRLSTDLRSLPSQARASQSRWASISVEARSGTTSGISASDRATTLRCLAATNPNPRDLVQPGHIFPMICAKGGVLVCSDLPEAALDVTILAGAGDCAAVIAALDESGEYADQEILLKAAAKEGVPALCLEELIRFRLRNEPLVQRVVEARLPTRLAGELRSMVYRSIIHEGEHVALVKGTPDPERPILIRVQPESTFSDVFGGPTPPSRKNLHESLARIGSSGEGILLYLRRPVFGKLSEQVQHTRADFFGGLGGTTMREYGIGAQILADLGVKKVRILSTSAQPLEGLETFGLEVVGYERLL